MTVKTVVDTVTGMDETPVLGLREARLSTTLAMSIAAGGAALIALFGERDPISWITIVFSLVGLIPWALEVKGVRLDPLLFVGMTMLPAAAIVLLDRNPGGLFPAYIAVVWITRCRSSRAVVAVGLAAAIGMTIGCGILEPSEFEGSVYFLGGLGVAWFMGALLHRQEALVAELRGAAERERVHAAVEERARIAREVHDVIAHSLTVTLLHVTGARRALANDPQRAATALERAEAVGRESLDSIRQVVGLLREAGSEPTAPERADEAPLPQISDIQSLVSGYRDAGMQVDASIDLEGVRAGVMTSLTAFRLVQEAMTNSLQHAPGAAVSLSIHHDEVRSVIVITIENRMRESVQRRRPGRREGLGIAGMVERVHAAGGSINVGPSPRGTWLIAAELPLDLAKERL